MPATKSAKSGKSSSSGKKSGRCWPGFTPVPGKKPFSKGSCKPTAKKCSTSKASGSKRSKS